MATFDNNFTCVFHEQLPIEERLDSLNEDYASHTTALSEELEKIKQLEQDLVVCMNSGSKPAELEVIRSQITNANGKATLMRAKQTTSHEMIEKCLEKQN